MPGLLQGGRCKWSSHSCIQALSHRHSTPTAGVKLLQSITASAGLLNALILLPPLSLFLLSFLPLLKCPASPRRISFFLFFLTNPQLHFLSASPFFLPYTFTLSLKDINTLHLKASATPSVLHTLPLVSHPRSSKYYLIPLRGKGMHALRGRLPRAAVRHGSTAASQTSIFLAEWWRQQVRVRLGQASNQPKVCRSDFDRCLRCGLSWNFSGVRNVSLWSLDLLGGVGIRSALCHCSGASAAQGFLSFLKSDPGSLWKASQY